MIDSTVCGGPPVSWSKPTAQASQGESTVTPVNLLSSVPGLGGVGPMQGLFLTPYEPSREDLDFDPQRDAPRMVETGSLYRADGVMYSSFRQHGGKVLLYTGLSERVGWPPNGSRQ